MTTKYSQNNPRIDLQRRRSHLVRGKTRSEDPEEEVKLQGIAPVDSCWTDQWYPSCMFTQVFSGSREETGPTNRRRWAANLKLFVVPLILDSYVMLRSRRNCSSIDESFVSTPAYRSKSFPHFAVGENAIGTVTASSLRLFSRIPSVKL